LSPIPFGATVTRFKLLAMAMFSRNLSALFVRRYTDASLAHFALRITRSMKNLRGRVAG
jgi:hypothetical protein